MSDLPHKIFIESRLKWCVTCVYQCTILVPAEGQLGVNLTVVPSFHSHLETMAALGRAELLEDITFSYLLEEDKTNTISLGGPFPPSVDPTR